MARLSTSTRHITLKRQTFNKSKGKKAYSRSKSFEAHVFYYISNIFATCEKNRFQTANRKRVYCVGYDFSRKHPPIFTVM